MVEHLASEISWEILDAAGAIVASGGAPITVADGTLFV